MLSHMQIDYLASASKLGVELSDIPHDSKELRKLCIDLTAEFAKMIAANSPKMRPIYGLNSEAIWRIREVARRYDLDKVVVYPVTDVFNNIAVVFRFYGNSSEAVMRQLGVIPMSLKTAQENADRIAQCERNYGITIFERSD